MRSLLKKSKSSEGISFWRNWDFFVFIFASGLSYWALQGFPEPESISRAPASVGVIAPFGFGGSNFITFGISQIVGLVFLGLARFSANLKNNFQKTNEELNLQKEKLLTLGELTAILSHELNNPLTSVRAFSQQIREELLSQSKSLPKASLEMWDRMDINIKRMMEISASLRGFIYGSQSEQLTTLEEILTESLNLVGPALRTQKIEVQKPGDNAEELHKKIKVSRVQLTLVIMNLLLNARDALAEKKSSDSQAVVCIGSQKSPSGGIQLWIENNGPRIPKELEEKIFEPFFTTKSKGRGTGMGLSLSRSLCEANGAKIFLDKKSKLTRFVIEFP